MAEYVANATQTVEAGQNVLFTEDVIPCNRGYVVHRGGSGIFTLRGISSSCFARYRVIFGGNIAVSEGGTAGPISVTLAIDGEVIPTSRAIVTPAAVGDYWNVTEFAFVTVPKGCCNTVSIENTSGQSIDIQNANIVIERVA